MRKKFKDSFVFYRDWVRAIREYPDEQQLAIYNAISDYAFEGVLPEDPIIKAVISVICATIGRNTEKWENTCEKTKARVAAYRAKKKAEAESENVTQETHVTHVTHVTDNDMICNDMTCNGSIDNTSLRSVSSNSNNDSSLRSESFSKEKNEKKKIENFEQSDALDTSAAGEPQPEKPKGTRKKKIALTFEELSQKIEIAPELKEPFEEFVNYRIEKGEALTERAASMAYKKLNNLSGGSNQIAMEIVSSSIISNWDGLFAPKGRSQSAYQHPTVLDQSQMKYKPF